MTYLQMWKLVYNVISTPDLRVCSEIVQVEDVFLSGLWLRLPSGTASALGLAEIL